MMKEQAIERIKAICANEHKLFAYVKLQTQYQIFMFDISDQDYMFRVSESKITAYKLFKFGDFFNKVDKATPPFEFNIYPDEFNQLLDAYLGEYAEQYRQLIKN